MASHSSRSGSHKHGRKGEKDREHKSREPSRKQEVPLSYFSFLFVVNEFLIHEVDDEGHNIEPVVDRYGNWLPPESVDSYGMKKIGQVWRFTNGVITPAGSQFEWYRERIGLPGKIYGPIPAKNYQTEELREYKTYSVFNCWRFLPCLCTDVDVSTVDGTPFGGWHSLAFSQPDEQNPGLTRIVYPGGPQRHVSGRDPAWLPHLLPHTFATPDPSAPRSIGLGGDLPIILALLALMKKPDHTDDVFQHGLWNRNGSGFSDRRSSQADPDPTGSPRGVMVQICCDSYNTDSTPEIIADFEARGYVIPG
ncbi:hypothetical protein CSAL01_02408 [Colletotrichum salicis]|uniref:Uncharacterized protein n=1 Tax=Colletotrichum salicis TaxID=1209931 RepID=A0A135UTK0_9PEZI|nr:hypothetical protein CSAL01_02408 [Colletotrichum salicis]